MIKADVLILGGGPAGLMCASRCAASGLSVLVLEKKGSPGRKLLASGSGRCNVSSARPLEEYLSAYGERGRFVKSALLNFPPAEARSFFENRGVPLTEMKEGKLFPKSQRAKDILDALVLSCADSGVSIRVNAAVSRLSRGVNGFTAEIPGGDEVFEAPFAVIASGGASYPATGSSGDGAALAAGLGHAIVPLRPALTALYVKDWDCGSCAGTSLEKAAVRILQGEKKIHERRGDVLFTHAGLSGPGILDSSRYVSPGDTVSLGLLPITPGEADERLLRACAENPKKNLKNILTLLGLSDALARSVLNRCRPSVPGDPQDYSGAAVPKALRLALGRFLTDFRWVVESLGGFGEAMATAGGVDTGEVNPKTMESTLVKGLYFAGEVLDVDGDTGGFNIQFALSSGALAADSILRSLRASSSGQTTGRKTREPPSPPSG